jgi:hypothetical protein
MNWEPEQDEKQALVRFDGRPNDSKVPHELTRWQKFKRWILPFVSESGAWAQYGISLADQYAMAEIDMRKSQAAKTAAEAANIAADTDIKRQGKVKLANQELRDIFADANSSDTAKMIQLASLLAANPEIHSQLDKIEDLLAKLHLTRGVNLILKPQGAHDGRTFSLDVPIRILELSVRTRKALQRLNINSIGELAARTEDELLGCKNFGQTSLNEIRQQLATFGLRLRE